MFSKELISVIIPTYNRAHLITDGIDSVLNQTYTNFELLVVDDHSTDNTKEVVEQYEDERVKYLVNGRSKGAQGARNTGLFAAEGEWIAMLDSDDMWSSNFIKDLLKIINENNKNVICISDNTNKNEGIVYSHKLRIDNEVGSFSKVLFNKRAACKVGGLDENLSAMQDMDFFYRLSSIGDIVVVNFGNVIIRTGDWERISTDYEMKMQAAIYFDEKHLFTKKDLAFYKSKARIVIYGLCALKFKSIRSIIPHIPIGIIRYPRVIGKDLIFGTIQVLNIYLKKTKIKRS